MESSSTNIMVTLAVLLFIIIGCVMFYNTEERFTARVINITEQRNVHGQDGTVSTQYDYIVTTDKGLYKIEPKGIFACPAFGALEKGMEYRFLVRGIRVDIIGVYPFIVEASKIKRKDEGK